MPSGRRTLSGEILDVTGAAAGFFGGSEKTVRSHVARRTIPFRRWGGRVVFLREELVAYFQALEGCGVEEALKNARTEK